MVSIADKGITFVRQGPVQVINRGFNMDNVLGYGDLPGQIELIILMQDLPLGYFGKLTKVLYSGTLVNKTMLLCLRVSQRLCLAR